VEQIRNRLIHVTGCQVVDLQRSDQVMANPVHGVQRCERVLENHLHLRRV